MLACGVHCEVMMVIMVLGVVLTCKISPAVAGTFDVPFLRGYPMSLDIGYYIDGEFVNDKIMKVIGDASQQR